MSSSQHTQFLIVGAGPYSLATAAYAKSLGADVIVVGKLLDLWKSNMPRGMFLRSGPDWHLDARDIHTFESYVQQRGYAHSQIKPVPLDLFLDYVSWFMGQSELTVHPALVTHLEKIDNVYHANLDDGTQITADNVLLGLGFNFFKHAPPEILEKLPPGAYGQTCHHTCDMVDFEFYRDKRVLIIGGRQSAFEWAALMGEKGAQEIHLTHRHPTPQFSEPDWSWVQPMARRTFADHSWWRNLSPAEQDRIRHNFWAAGRLILEMWLDARVHQPNIHIHGETNISSVTPRADKTYDVTLDDGSQFNVHYFLLATGYRPNMHNIAFLDRATILDPLSVTDGYPNLDPEFQTNLPDLYVTGLAATRDFGPFFGFTVACPVAAKIIGDAVAASP